MPPPDQAPSCQPLILYIGLDSREAIASDVAVASISRNTRTPFKSYFLNHRKLRKAGYFQRPWIIDADTGNWRDLLDSKPFSTEFSHTRFLVPELQKFKGWALFMDSDMIFNNHDIKKLFDKCDPKYAVMVVKHHQEVNGDTSKMDGRAQLKYFRKNWSSFVLWNCSHPSNRGLTKEKVNFAKGSDLHSFSWLRDEEIGALSYNYNYISGVSPILSDKPYVIHFSCGGPWFDECKAVPYADLWDHELRLWHEDGSPSYDHKLIDRSLDKVKEE